MNETALPQLGLYRHYKGGQYELLGVARHSETEELMAVYRPLYGDRELWVRPLAMFMETVEQAGTVKPRFEFIGEPETSSETVNQNPF